MKDPLTQKRCNQMIGRLSFLKYLFVGTGLVFFARKVPAQANPERAHVHPAIQMATAGEVFLNSLSLDQRSKATISFEDSQRQDWHFIPRARKGIPFKGLDPSQRQLANALLNTGLSRQGFIKASCIISLEPILKEIEQGSGPARDAELYYFTLFGVPRSSKPWGWRVEGHHLSLNFTVVNNERIASTPCFFGANPAEVMHGPRQGLRTLASEEDLAKTLLKSLAARQRTLATLSDRAPEDILSASSRKANPIQPFGLPASQLNGNQSEILMSLLKEYAENMPSEIAAQRLEKLRSVGFSNIYFGWAGGVERGQAHYYRIQGPTFLIEYDNIQNNANHIHSVWRDFNEDFGLDLLAEHYRKVHHSG